MKKKLLFLSRWFPFPADNGSRLRILNLLRLFSQEYHITLVSFWEGSPPSSDHLEYIQAYCPEIHPVPYPLANKNITTSITGLLSGKPKSLIERDSQPMRTLIRRLVANTNYELVLASQIDMAPFALEAPGAIRILDELEVSSYFTRLEREKNPLKKLRLSLTLWKQKAYLETLLPHFAGITSVSKEEIRAVLRQAPGVTHTQVIPNGVTVEPLGQRSSAPVPGRMIYSGSISYHPNFDAVQYFLEHSFPLIDRQYPGVSFHVTGSIDGVCLDPFRLLDNVVFIGYVPEVRPLIAESWVSVVPLRLGGGTRLKILEAMALGTPVVSTSKGAEGLDVQHDRDLLIADPPEEFAAAVYKILIDPGLRSSIGNSGRRLVETTYSWDRIGGLYLSYLDRVISQASRPRQTHRNHPNEYLS